MHLAPIVLFVYNRRWHTEQTISSLQRNLLARDSELFIFSDGPKGESDKQKIEDVRSYIRTISGFKRLQIIERNENLGLAASIISGISEIVGKYGKIIVLEDDLVSSPFFLTFMNEALEIYEYEEKIISIHGYVYPVKAQLPETFFLRGADCLGWATWKRGWDLFEPDALKLLNELKRRKLTRQFDINNTYGYTNMLKAKLKGRNDLWAILWYASAFLKNKLTLYPGKSLIRHIGNDGSGTHCGISDFLDTELSLDLIIPKNPIIEENGYAFKTIEDFFKLNKTTFLSSLSAKLNRWFKNKIRWTA